MLAEIIAKIGRDVAVIGMSVMNILEVEINIEETVITVSILREVVNHESCLKLHLINIKNFIL